MNRTKYIPAIVMLTAGFVVCIVTFLNKYSLKGALMAILFTMVGFLIIGYMIKFVVNKFIIIPMMEEAERRAQEEAEEAAKAEEEPETETGEESKEKVD